MKDVTFSDTTYAFFSVTDRKLANVQPRGLISGSIFRPEDDVMVCLLWVWFWGGMCVCVCNSRVNVWNPAALPDVRRFWGCIHTTMFLKTTTAARCVLERHFRAHLRHRERLWKGMKWPCPFTHCKGAGWVRRGVLCLLKIYMVPAWM